MQVAIYFESENEIKFYNLKARKFYAHISQTGISLVNS